MKIADKINIENNIRNTRRTPGLSVLTYTNIRSNVNGTDKNQYRSKTTKSGTKKEKKPSIIGSIFK